jgi:hypothetical protein
MFLDNRWRVRLDEEAHVCEGVVPKHLFHRLMAGSTVRTLCDGRTITSSEEGAGCDALRVIVDQAGRRVDSPSTPIHFLSQLHSAVQWKRTSHVQY